MTELHKCYCIPKTEADFDALGDRSKWCLNNGVAYGPIPFWEQKTNGKSEVPVSRFSDLLHDRIAPWRLEEVGFNSFEHADKVRAYELMPTEDCAMTVLYYDYGTEIQVFPTDIDGETGSG